MAKTRRARTPSATMLIAIAIPFLVLAIPFAVMVGSQDSAANSIWPLIVRGYIEDSEGNKIEGANVTIEMVNETSGLVTKTYYVDSTPASGAYLVTFNGGEWDPGDTIRVTATFGFMQDENTTIALNVAVQWVNVTLYPAIPEFGSIFGVSTSIITIGLIAMVVATYRKKRQDSL